MRKIFFGIAALLAIFLVGVEAQGGGFPPLPPPNPVFNQPQFKTNCTVNQIFTDAGTKYNYSGSASACKTFCLRRSVRTWSNGDWQLYGQLWNEANSRGWIEDFREGHQLDNCTGNINTGPHFHFNESFLAWHRFFISHYEQIFQKIDHEINPGRARRNGEFCLGYFDWGYKEPYSNDFTNQVYQYVFGPQAVGTILNGTNQIPDGYYQNVSVGNAPVFRAPFLGNATPNAPYTPNSWNSVVVSSCIQIQDMVGQGATQALTDPANGTSGFWRCIEQLPHASVHLGIGGLTGDMGNLSLSSSDPVFFLHHTMVDYIWYIWQGYSDKTYPQSWNTHVIPAPYDAWQCQVAKDYRSFCYDYQTNDPSVRTRSNYSSSNLAPGSWDELDETMQAVVEDVLTQGQPGVIPREQYAGILSMASSGEEAEQMYQDYLKYVNIAKQNHAKVVNQYQGSYNKAKNTSYNVPTVPLTVSSSSPTSSPKASWASPVGSPPSPSSPSPSGKTSKDVVDCLNFLSGMNNN